MLVGNIVHSEATKVQPGRTVALEQAQAAGVHLVSLTVAAVLAADAVQEGDRLQPLRYRTRMVVISDEKLAIGLALGLVRVDQVGVNTDAVDREAGRAVRLGDLLTSVGRQTGKLAAGIVLPIVAVRLGQEQLHDLHTFGRQFLGKLSIRVRPEVRRRHANRQLAGGIPLRADSQRCG